MKAGAAHIGIGHFSVWPHHGGLLLEEAANLLIRIGWVPLDPDATVLAGPLTNVVHHVGHGARLVAQLAEVNAGTQPLGAEADHQSRDDQQQRKLHDEWKAAQDVHDVWFLEAEVVDGCTDLSSEPGTAGDWPVR